jgi:hypothetical protein
VYLKRLYRFNKTAVAFTKITCPESEEIFGAFKAKFTQVMTVKSILVPLMTVAFLSTGKTLQQLTCLRERY